MTKDFVPALSALRSSKGPVSANYESQLEGPKTDRLVQLLGIGHSSLQLDIELSVSTRSNPRNAKPETAFGEGGRMFSAIFS